MSFGQAISIDFREPTNLAELAKFIGIDEKLFNKAVDPNEENPLFFKHRIPKKGKKYSGQHRVVWEAHPFIADAYKAFSRRFELYARYAEPRYPHPCAYGYVRGKSTIDNASPHCTKALILHADIKDFFPSISKDKIKNLLGKLGLQEEVIDILGRFLTIENSLPLGLHPSPLLANLVCLNLDEKLYELAQTYKCTYTRYADDITISGNFELPNKEEIENILSSEGFLLSQHKFRITKPGQAHYVTGLSVIDKRPRAPRKMKKHLRKELYYCKKYGIEEHIDRITTVKDYNYMQRGINRIDGMVRYIGHIEKDAFPHLRQEWQALLEDQGLEISYETIYDQTPKHFKFFIDECEIQHKGKHFLALSFVQTEDWNEIAATTTTTHRKHLIDPFADGKKQELAKKGLHYSDATQDLRKAYTDQLSTFPFKSYLAYAELPSPSEYAELYAFLIKEILPHRLMGCDYSAVELVFEENSKIKQPKIKEAVESIYKQLEQTNNRRPYALEITFGKKLE